MHLPVGTLAPGIGPARVMQEAVLVLGSRHEIEKTDVEAPVIEGRRVGRIVLRFAVDPATRPLEDAAAQEAIAAVIDHLGRFARLEPTSALLLTRTAGRRTVPLPLP